MVTSLAGVVIEEVERIINELIGRMRLRLGKITKFRQNTFDLTLHWTENCAGDEIDKNLHIFYLPAMEGVVFPGTLVIEGSAWKDSQIARRWQTKVFKRLEVNSLKEIRKIKRPILKAFEQIENWSLADLTLISPLQSPP